MARRRSRQSNDSNGESTQTTGGNRTMAGLDPQVIAALLSKSRTKGQYVERINEFLANGEAGISVSEQWPDMSGKNASTLKQGFDNAKDHKEAADGADQIKVVKSDEGVFLINLALVETAEAA